MLRIYRLFIGIFLGLGVAVFSYSQFSVSAPKLANLYYRWDIPSGELPQLAKWDVVVLDMENQITNPDKLRELKRLNPNIILLAYITAQEIKDNASTNAGTMRRRLASGIKADWYLTDTTGKQFSFWPGTKMLNPTDICPTINGLKWNTYLANFTAKEILATGLWDGVFYDNTWGEVNWFTKNKGDFDKNGVAETDADAHWRAGMNELFNTTRRLAGGNVILVGNAITKEYANSLNGMTFENFTDQRFNDAMAALKIQLTGSRLPRTIILNANTSNTGKRTDYQRVRYGLGVALVSGNGVYYSFDYGDKDHTQVWWYDEYDVELGQPIGEPISLNGAGQFREDVWRRDYTNGIVLVNATGVAQEIDLGGDYEKIIGVQDPVTNNGSIVSRVKIPARDGLVLRKTLAGTQSLNNIVFGNGGFVRFFDYKGKRARNGFFAFADGVVGGAKIYLGDLDNNGLNEKIIATGPRLEIFNSAGARWFNDLPFDGGSNTNIRLAVGRGANKQMQIVAGNNKNGQINLYSYFGELKKTVYPFDKKYRSGLFVAATGDAVLVGSGGARAGEVLVYDNNLTKIKKRFFPYDKKYTGSVKVAAGDINGDSKTEIITLGKINGKQLARVFTLEGKKISEFVISTTFASTDLAIGVLDVNSDGKGEIVVEGN